MARFKGITIILLLAFVVLASAAQTKPASVLLQEGLYAEEIEGNLEAAIKVYERILEDFPKDRPVAAKALLHIGLSYEKLGKQEAHKAYRRVIQEFADQREVVAQARIRLSSLEQAVAPTESKGMTVRKVWEGSGLDDCGEISPDGKYLSYVDWNTGDLAVYEIATGKKRHITNKGSWDDSDEFAVFSRWSPDSKQIVYSWYNKQEHYDLRVIGIDDAEPRALFSDPNCDSVHPCDWSKDGKRILAWLWRKDSGEVVQISVMDGDVQVVKKLNKDGFDNFVFSSEGNDIIYDAPPERESGNHDIFLFSIESRTERALVKHPSHDYVLGWGSDGKHLLFASDRTGTSDIWAIKVVDGKTLGAPQLIKSEKGPIPLTGLGSTTEGLFYYCNFPGRTDVYVTEIDPKTGEIVVPPHEAINRFVGSNGTPDYSTDGKYLAYVSRRGPFNRKINRPIGNVLCIRSLETGEDREFRPPSLNKFGFPRWSPDSRSVMVVNWEDDGDRMGHYVIDAGTGKAKLAVMTQEPRRIHHHAWSADGKSVFLVRSDKVGDRVRIQIVVREIASGMETELLSGTWRDVYSISRSPDGRWLAVVGKGKKRNLRIIPATGGEPRIIHTFEQGDNSTTHHVWSADGKYIFLTKLRPPKTDLKWDLCRIPVDGGQVQSLGLEMNTFWWLSAHSDGRHIAFSSRASDYDLPEVWAMENFLPTAPVATSEPTMTVRQVRMESGGFTSLSPDGKYLCDVDWDTGNLVVRELATGNVRPLTDKGSWEQFAGFATISTISRDSKKVAFLWYNHERQCFDLREIGLDGSGDRVVRRFLEKDKEMEWLEPAAWSPDGKQILVRFSIEEERNQIAWVSTADGSMRTVKVLNESWPGKIDVSPDGRYILYDLPQEEETSRRDIFAFDIEQNREVPLVQHPADDKFMGWTPDGRHIFFTSNRMGSWDGWILPVARGERSGLPELVKASMGDVSSIGFTPGGSFYYTPAYGPRGVYAAALDLQTGKVLSSPRPVRHTGTEELPDWSPDGKYLAYCTRPRGEKSQIIHIRSVETGQERQLDAKLPYFHWLRWSPEGRSILVGGLEEKNLRNVVYKVDVLTSERTVVLRTETGMIPGAALSPDGKALVYSHWDGAARSAWFMVRDLETGLEKQLVRAAICPHPYLGWALSPDGKQLAFILEFPAVRTLNTISTTGGQPKELLRMKEEQASDVAWTGDSQNVLFMRGNALWRIPAEGGEPRKLWTWEKRHLSFEGICVHPDGRNLAFDVREVRSEVWVMENFLPELDDSQ